MSATDTANLAAPEIERRLGSGFFKPRDITFVRGAGARLFDAAWRVLENWERPLITAYGKADPVLGWFDSVFQEYVPGAKGRAHRSFAEAGHFIQEYEPEALVEVIDEVARAAKG